MLRIKAKNLLKKLENHTSSQTYLLFFFGLFFVNRLSCPPAHFCTITEVRSNGSFSQCELIMRQAVIKTFALIVHRVIGGGGVYSTQERLRQATHDEKSRGGQR